MLINLHLFDLIRAHLGLFRSNLDPIFVVFEFLRTGQRVFGSSFWDCLDCLDNILGFFVLLRIDVRVFRDLIFVGVGVF